MSHYSILFHSGKVCGLFFSPPGTIRARRANCDEALVKLYVLHGCSVNHLPVFDVKRTLGNVSFLKSVLQ